MELKLREKILHIVNMALMLNGVNGIETFIRFFGHCTGIDVEVYENGWKEGNSASLYETIYFDADIDCASRVDSIIEYLEGLAKRNNINVAL
jgi:hypothetical protein